MKGVSKGWHSARESLKTERQPRQYVAKFTCLNNKMQYIK